MGGSLELAAGGTCRSPHLFDMTLSLSQGNAIYNLLPDIISRLSAPEGGVEEEPFHTIMK